MSQQVQELIDKIKSEGIQEAEQKAGELESAARKKADELIDAARKKADQIVAEAKAESAKTKEATRMALHQASRDMLLQLRKEIEALLQRIVAIDIKDALTPEQLADLISAVVTGYVKENKDVKDVAVVLNEKDLKNLKEGFLKKIKDKVSQSITLHPADDMGAGFTISFDKGKSFFDFSDESLVAYLSGYLNAEVANLLQQTVEKK